MRKCVLFYSTDTVESGRRDGKHFQEIIHVRPEPVTYMSTVSFRSVMAPKFIKVNMKHYYQPILATVVWDIIFSMWD